MENRAVLLIWLAALAGCLAVPFVAGLEEQGDALVRNTIRLTLAGYAAALLLPARREQLARLLWTLAWVTYLIHVALAFHFFHGWSHLAAMEHVRAASGVGEGLYFSYLFTLLWTADVVWWWRKAEGRRRRPRWLSIALHGFMLFIVFNAAVVFAAGAMRWAGVILFEVLLRNGAFRLMTRKRSG